MEKYLASIQTPFWYPYCFFKRVWGVDVDGYSYGGEVSKWLSDYLEVENMDLVVFGNELKPRSVKVWI